MTLYEKYYAMNAALNVALIAQNIKCPVFKYGVVAPVAPMAGSGSEPSGGSIKYPYIQTTYRTIKRQPYGSDLSGTLTDFEYILNFFTAAGHERQNDSALFIPYETARELITNPALMIFSGIASVLEHDETPEFNFKGGLEIIQKGLVFKCQTVVTHVIEDTTTITTTDQILEVVESAMNFE